MGKQTHGSMSRDACGRACTYARGSALTDVSTYVTSVYGSMYLCISNRDTGVHRVTPQENPMVKTVIQGRTNANDKYGGYKPKQDIYTDLVGKIWSSISYADDPHQDY